MAQLIHKLSDAFVRKVTKPGMYADGGGLYLQVRGKDSKSWILRYSLRGAAHEMGLGSLRKKGLADARSEVRDLHRQLEDHLNPIEERKKRRAANALAAAKTITFKDAAAQYTATHRVGLKNRKHAQQWVNTLATYAEPVIGDLSVRDIDIGHVHRVLEPIWFDKPETAKRLRGRIEAILNWARVKRYRDGENPAQWRGRLDQLFPAPSKVRKVEHHAALHYDDLPAFIRKLRDQEGSAARALEFAILTVGRTSEVLEATRNEIDSKAKVWTVSANRMKAGKEHRVPLSARAVELAGSATGAYLFPGRYPEKPLSNMALLMMLRRIGHGDVTAHGFRSSFKDWARDRTRFDNYVVEAALAHASGDKIEAAYARSDVLEKRRKLMEAWAEYCASEPAEVGRVVVPLRAS